MCEREKCPKNDTADIFDIIRFEIKDGIEFIPSLDDKLDHKRIVYVDELLKDDGTMEKLS